MNQADIYQIDKSFVKNPSCVPVIDSFHVTGNKQI